MLSHRFIRSGLLLRVSNFFRYIITFKPSGRRILPEDEAEAAVPKWSWVPYRVMRAMHERHMSNQDYWNPPRLSKMYNMHIERVEGIILLIERENEYRRKGMNFPKYAHDYMDQWTMLDLHVAASHLAESEKESARALEFTELLESSILTDTVYPRTIPENVDFGEFASTTIRRLEKSQLRETYVPTVADHRRLVDEANANTIIPAQPAPIISKSQTKSRLAFREPSKKDKATLIVERNGDIRHATLEDELKRSWSRKPTYYNQFKSNYMMRPDPRPPSSFPADFNEFEGRMAFPWVYNHLAKVHKGENPKMFNRQLLPTHTLQEIMFGHSVDPVFRLQILWRDAHAVLTETAKFVENPSEATKKELIAYLTDLTKLGINSWDPASVEELSEHTIPTQLDEVHTIDPTEFNYDHDLRNKLGKLIDRRRRAKERHDDELIGVASTVKIDDDDLVFDFEEDKYGGYRGLDGKINMKRFMIDLAVFREESHSIESREMELLTEMADLLSDDPDIPEATQIENKAKFDQLAKLHPDEGRVVSGEYDIAEYLAAKLTTERQRYADTIRGRIDHIGKFMDDRRVKSKTPFTVTRERIERQLRLLKLDPHNMNVDQWTKKKDLKKYTKASTYDKIVDMSFALPSVTPQFTSLDKTTGLYELLSIKRCQERLVKNGGGQLDGVLNAEYMDKLNLVLSEVKLMAVDDKDDDDDDEKRPVAKRAFDEYDDESDSSSDDDSDSDSSSDDDDDDDSDDDDDALNKASRNTKELAEAAKKLFPVVPDEPDDEIHEDPDVDDDDDDGGAPKNNIFALDDNKFLNEMDSLITKHHKIESKLTKKQLASAKFDDLLLSESRHRKTLHRIHSMNDKKHSRPIADSTLDALGRGNTGDDDDEIEPAEGLMDAIKTCHTTAQHEIDMKWDRIKGFLDGTGVEVNERQKTAIVERKAKIGKWAKVEGKRLKKIGRTLVIDDAKWVMPPCCEDPHDLVPVQIQREIDGLYETMMPGFLSEGISGKTQADVDYFDHTVLDDHSFSIDKDMNDYWADEEKEKNELTKDRKYYHKILDKYHRLSRGEDISRRKDKLILEEEEEGNDATVSDEKQEETKQQG